MRSTARSTSGMRSSAQGSETLRRMASTSSRCDSTPRTIASAYPSGGAGSWASSVSASTPRTGTLVAEAEGSFPGLSSGGHRGSRPSRAGEVLPRPGVHLDATARLDEQGDLHDEARLQRGRLAAPGDAVALHAGLGLGDLELDGCGELDADNAVLVYGHDRGVALLEVPHCAAEIGSLDVKLLVAVGVHEHVRVALAVQVLHRALVDDRQRDLLVGPKRLVDDGAGPEVLQLCADERAALPRLHVLELDDRHEAFGEIQGHAVLQVVGGDAHSTKSLGNPVRTSAPSPVPGR